MKRFVLGIAGGVIVASAAVGRWLASDPTQEAAPTATRTESEKLEQLRALPYAGWGGVSPSDTAEGVRPYDHARVSRGANLYSLADESAARLIDMDGNILHTWENDRTDWHHVELDPDGNLFVVGENALVKMDWNSNVIWTTKGTFHHDLAIAPDGTLYALASDPRYVSYGDTPVPIIDDLIVTMSPEGTLVDTVSLWELFGAAVDSTRMEKTATLLDQGLDVGETVVRTNSDVFHANSVELVGESLDGIADAGDLLVSIREMNTVAIIHVGEPQVRWSWGEDELVRQHHPSLLDDGNILIFDNRTPAEGSRVIEVDPESGEIEWTYSTDDPRDFWSRLRGSCQRLANGNTLITESDQGRAFEVTRKGTVVWEMKSRVRSATKRIVEREAIYRMVRIDRSILAGLPFEDGVRRRLARDGYFEDASLRFVGSAPDKRLPLGSR